jgi:hypothetical protein
MATACITQVWQARPDSTPKRQFVQPKSRVGPVDDPLEREADQVADAVVAGAPVAAIIEAPSNTAQRKCAECEAEEEQPLRRKSKGSAGAPAAALPSVTSAISQGGLPLSSAERAYFEPRFKRDLSAIRIHTHDQAGAAASGMNARAFTLGQDIAFAPGEYQPQTGAGRRLIAHELVHALQQEKDEAPVVRRATYGTGTPPAFANRTVTIVPQNEHETVDASMAIIDEVAADPRRFFECHDHFARHCPSGNSASLANAWQQAAIWRITTPGATENARGRVNGTDIAYTRRGFEQGTEGLAGTLLHEAGHNCGVPGGATHWRLSQIRSYCIGPSRNEFSSSFSASWSGDLPLWLFSYRRFLGDWAGGRLRLTLGGDINVLGLTSEIASYDQPSDLRLTGEFGSAMAGFQVRAGGWGGTRFGGISFRVETGVGVGRFTLRQASPGELPATTREADWILQVGPRAEFAIKSGDDVNTFSIGAALRLATPLNEDARTLQGILLSVEYRAAR